MCEIRRAKIIRAYWKRKGKEGFVARREETALVGLEQEIESVDGRLAEIDTINRLCVESER